ncbi:phosphate binding protein [Metamycoplasma arthritidis]|uniref:Phosphate binding protein PstS n=1 Tax=Metamycoplasma arthritidis (strain 158L3-1) TaxID=243272 RepID=B3PNH8_META1|nr:substrate-binding domain-containing protein [Metamycoplasma arthritidis]ACF07580.1 phosphate binding protein PstS [Metamycoplasma arthritidis 158L3-1]VEU79088.1 phosphate binding protein [Metamycoplasma arthritidis]
MKKVFNKNMFFISITTTCSLVCLVTLVSTSFPKVNLIVASGSSSMQPLLNALINQQNQKNLEVNVQPRGSVFGINKLMADETTLALSSKSPRKDIKRFSLLEKWTAKEIKTTTIGLEGIGILAKLPADASANDYEINEANISKLYEAFAGHKQVALSEFSAKKATEDDKYFLKPFARDGGAFNSGTAESFLENSGFKNLNISSTDLVSLEGKQNYGNFTKTTAESNSEAFSYFSKEGKEVGSITYLSLGYILKNLEKIKAMGYTLLNVRYQNEIIEPNNRNIELNKYRWWRPFNVLTSLKSINKTTKEFLERILFDNNDEVFASLGVLKTPPALLKKMYHLSEQEFNDPNFDFKKHLDKFYVADSKLKSYGVENE